MRPNTITAAIATAALAAAAAAGCSAPAAPVTPASVARQIGATITGKADTGPYAKAAAAARWHGKAVTIATFASDAEKGTYIKYVVKINKAFGFKAAPLAQGHDYVVFPTG